MAVQTTTNTYPGRGLPGELSRPNEPYAIDMVPVQVPSGGRKPRPGDMVSWNATANGAAAVTNAATRLTAFGIVHYDLSKVQDTLASVPSGADTAEYIEYEDGEFAPVITVGTVYVRAGTAVEYGNRLQQQADFKWDPHTRVATESYVGSFTCVSLSGVDNGLVEVRVAPAS